MQLDSLNIRYFRSDRYINKDLTFDNYSDLPRPFATIGIIREGSWSYSENFQHSSETHDGDIRAGELLYIPQGATYSATWHSGPGGVSECISVHFEMNGSLLSSRRTRIQKLQANENTHGCIEALLKLYRDNESSGETEAFIRKTCIMSQLYLLISGLADQITIGSDCIDPLLLPALDYLGSHSTEHISAAELAAMCYISESYFYVLFKRSIGIPFTEYKNSLVISKAERLLIEKPELSVEEISRKLGFSSSAYFRRVFQSFLGCSPREYRASHVSNGAVKKFNGLPV